MHLSNLKSLETQTRQRTPTDSDGNLKAVMFLTSIVPGADHWRHSLARPGFGPAWLWLAGPFESKGEIYSAPEGLETTNRYNENDGVSKRVHELAFGTVICFTGSLSNVMRMPVGHCHVGPARVQVS